MKDGGWQSAVRRWLDDEQRSQAFLARLLGLSTQHFNRVMTGRSGWSEVVKNKLKGMGIEPTCCNGH